MKSLFQKIGRILSLICLHLFGSIQWKAPRWIIFLSLGLIWPFRPHKKNLFVLLLLLGSAGGYWWYKNLPEPYKINFTLSLPYPTHFYEQGGGVVQPLLVTFTGSAAKLDKVGKEVAKGIIVSPALPGVWKWDSDSLLKFQPAQDWEVGKHYTVKFEKNLFANPVILSEYSFEFDSPRFTISPSNGSFYEDPTDPKIKQAVFTMSLSHPIDKSSLERHISIKMRVDPVKSYDDPSIKPLGFKIVYKDTGEEAYVRSDPISIPDRDGEILITIDKGVLSSRQGTPTEEPVTYTVSVPGIESYFKLLSAQATTITNQKTYEAERILTVDSTAAVPKDEIIKNLEVYLLSDDPKLYQNLPSSERDFEAPNAADDESYNTEDEAPAPSASTWCPVQSAGQITPAILQKAQKLSVNWIPTEQEYSKLHTFKFSAPEKRCLYVKVKKGTKSFGDFPLINDYDFLTYTDPFPATVSIIGDGAILSIAGDKKLSVMTRNVNELHFKLFRILPNALHHLINQTDYYSSFKDPSFNYNFGPEQISEVYSVDQKVPPGNAGVPRYVAFDFSPYLSSAPSVPRGLFILEASGWDPVTKQTIGDTNKRLILISDIGFLIKETQFGTRDLFATSVSKGGGLANAQASVLGKNGLPIFSGTTDVEGHVLIPSLKNFSFEKEPTVFVVQKDGDLSFMPYQKRDRELNYSRFDIGGLYTQKELESLQGYLFSDRGIYRPGETAHIGVIVKNTDWAVLPKSLPLEISVSDPRGIELVRKPISVGEDGFVEFTYPVAESALTGSYPVTVSIARPKKSAAMLGNTSIRVDEFVPDRLKIDAKLHGADDKRWYNPQSLMAEVTLRNLYGTAAAGNTVRGTLRLSPAQPYYASFSDYTFFNPFKSPENFSETIGEYLTTENGEAKFDLDLSRFDKAIYSLFFVAEGFEKESGKSVIANLSAMINPLDFMVGYKADGDTNFIKKDSVRKLELIAIDPHEQKTEAKNLTLELFEKRYLSVLTKQQSGSLAYQSVEKTTSLSTQALTIPIEGFGITVPATNPGNYFYQIKDDTGLVIASIPFSIVGEANLSRDIERNAELKIKLDKKEYKAGDEIQIEIQAPYTGTGLITIERNKVFASKWFTTNTTSTVQTIKVPEGIEGNGYVNVSFARSLSSPEVFMSPLSYGVEPFSMSKESRTEPITLEVPTLITPGQDLQVSVSTRETARTALYAVDEGILQVARYKRPDPLSHFFRKKALEVKTTQILDLLLPEFKLLESFAAAGGDEDAMLSRHRNPFKRKGQKPVVFWSGIVETGPTPKTFTIQTPDYFNGSVKVFAVSVTNNSIGVNEKQVTVQGDIVLTPSAPLAAAPGDTFEVSAVVANVRGKDAKTELSIETDKGLKLKGAAEQTLDIPLGKDTVVHFNVEAQELLGPSNIKFKAKNGGAVATYTIDLSVRPSSPLLTTMAYGTIKAGLFGGAKETFNLNRTLYPDFAEQSVNASVVPLGLSHGLAKYLEKYPWGCSEQLASQGYPSLVFIERSDLGVDQAAARKSLQKIILLLSARQNDDGSFKLWPNYNADTYLSLHIIHLLFEARQKGLDVSDTLYANAKSFLRTIANASVSTTIEARSQAYAIYLLTREGEVTTSYLSALRGAYDRFTDDSWKKDIGALYMASTYGLLKMDEEATSIAKAVPDGYIASERNYYEDELSHLSQYLYLLSKHFPEKAKNLKPAFLETISSKLVSHQYNTMSAALLIVGLNEYQKALGAPAANGMTVGFETKDNEFTPVELSKDLFSRASIPLGIKKIQIEADQKLPIFYSVEQTGFDKQAPSAVQKGIEIIREYRNMKGEVINEAALGDDIQVRILVRAIDDASVIGQVAIIDLFPAGFELQDGSLSLSSPTNFGTMAWNPIFTDAREDRALLYGFLYPQASEYVYKVKAISKGTFIVPPVQVEAMYNQRFVARDAPAKFTIH